MNLAQTSLKMFNTKTVGDVQVRLSPGARLRSTTKMLGCVSNVGIPGPSSNPALGPPMKGDRPNPDVRGLGEKKDASSGLNREEEGVGVPNVEGGPEKKEDNSPPDEGRDDSMSNRPPPTAPPSRNFERKKSISLDGTAAVSSSIVPAKRAYAQRSNSVPAGAKVEEKAERGVGELGDVPPGGGP